MDKQALFDQIKGGLIVSCQALEHEPLYTKEGGIMPLMAKAAAQSGAVGIRANTVRDITQIKEAVDLPVIGIIKKDYEGTPMYITVTMKEVDELVACGADILAVQGTSALRPDGSTAAQFIEAIKAKYPEQLVMADCATIEEGIACANAGADFVGTTMRGYTPETQGCDDIDFDFIHELSEKCPAKIIAEGHIHYPEQADQYRIHGDHVHDPYLYHSIHGRICACKEEICGTAVTFYTDRMRNGITKTGYFDPITS